MEKGHMPVRRGLSWSPGGLRKPFSMMQNPETERTAPWEDNKEQKTSKSLFVYCFPFAPFFSLAHLNLGPHKI